MVDARSPNALSNGSPSLFARLRLLKDRIGKLSSLHQSKAEMMEQLDGWLAQKEVDRSAFQSMAQSVLRLEMRNSQSLKKKQKLARADESDPGFPAAIGADSIGLWRSRSTRDHAQALLLIQGRPHDLNDKPTHCESVSFLSDPGSLSRHRDCSWRRKISRSKGG